MTMSESHSISEMLVELKHGSQEAAQDLWERCVRRLAAHADRKVGAYRVRVATGEDVAVDVFHSLCRGAQNGRFPRLKDRDDLWQVLFMLTKNKVIDANRRRQPEFTESVLFAPGASVSEQLGVCLEPDGGLSPDFEAASTEELQRLLGLLAEDRRAVAVLKMAGYTVKEISRKLDLAPRTVERHLSRIREIWTAAGAKP